MAGGVFIEQVVKHTLIVQRFGNGDLQLPVGGIWLGKAGVVEQNIGDGDDEQEEEGVADVAHAGGKAQRHCQKQAGDLPCAAWNRAEAHQAERTHHGDAGAQVAVNQHDDGLHDDRQKGQGDHKALGVGVAVAVNPGGKSAQNDRGEGAQQDGLPADRAGDDAGKESVKHKVCLQRCVFFLSLGRDSSCSSSRTWRRRLGKPPPRLKGSSATAAWRPEF